MSTLEIASVAATFIIMLGLPVAIWLGIRAAAKSESKS